MLTANNLKFVSAQDFSLGLAIGFSAEPSSSKGKILCWETTTNSPNNKQMSLFRCAIHGHQTGQNSAVALPDRANNFGVYKYQFSLQICTALYHESYITKFLWRGVKSGGTSAPAAPASSAPLYIIFQSGYT